MAVVAFSIGSFGDILSTIELVCKLARVVKGTSDIPSERQQILHETQSIQPIFLLVDDLLKQHSNTPIGNILHHTIRPEIARYEIAAKEIMEELQSSKLTLSYYMGWTLKGKTAKLTATLGEIRSKLVTLIIVLLGVGLVSNSTAERYGMPIPTTSTYFHMTRLEESSVSIIDVLGVKITVPIGFCTDWESMDYVIKGYFKNRAGQRYIDKGRYELVRPSDNSVLDRQKTRNTIKAGDVFEMSVIIVIEDEESRQVCPRCKRENFMPDKGWKTCRFCSGSLRFYLVKSRYLATNTPPTAEDVKFFRRISLRQSMRRIMPAILRRKSEAEIHAEREAEVRAEHDADVQAEREMLFKVEYKGARLKAQHEALLKTHREGTLNAQWGDTLRAQREALLKAQHEALEPQHEALLKAQLKARRKAWLEARREARLDP